MPKRYHSFDYYDDFDGYEGFFDDYRESYANQFTRKKPKNAKPDCKNGPACRFLRDQGFCRYGHPEAEKPRAVYADDPVQPTCPKCATSMALKEKNGSEFWACPQFPKCKSTIPIADPKDKCEKCGHPMVQRSGTHGSFLGCSRYPSCDHRISATAQRNQMLKETSIEELCTEGQLKSQMKDRLADFLRSVKLPVGGTKEQLIERIQVHFDQPTTTELARRAEVAREQARLQLEAQKNQARIDTFNATKIVPPKDRLVKEFPNKAQSYIWPQRHGDTKQIHQAPAAACDLKALPTVTDFAVGITCNHEPGRVVFYDPIKPMVLSPAVNICLKDIVSEKVPGTGVVDHYHYDPESTLNGKFWVEIFQEDGHVYIIFSELNKSGDSGGQCWAFRVPEAIYQNAWAALSSTLKTRPLLRISKEHLLDVKQIKKLKAVELKKWLLDRNLPQEGLKADLVERVMEVCGL